jgi:hypothetical protein
VALSTLAYVVVALLQRSTMSQQLETMRAQMSLQERPWISEDIGVAKTLSFDKELGTMNINILLKNTGHSVAINVHPFCKLVPEPVGPIGANVGTVIGAVEQDVRGSLGDQADNDPEAGYTMFPDSTIRETDGVSISRQDVANAIRSNTTKDARLHALLICCVDYRFTFEFKTHHQSRRSYIFGVPGPFPGSWYGITPVGTINNLFLIPNFQGNVAE